MAEELYATGQIFVDGIVIADAQNVGIDYDTQDNDVETMGKEFAGITPGAFKTTINIDTAVPRAGYEVDYLKRMVNRTAVEVVVFRGASEVEFKGFIRTVSEKVGVNQNGTASVQIRAGAPKGVG